MIQGNRVRRLHPTKLPQKHQRGLPSLDSILRWVQNFQNYGTVEIQRRSRRPLMTFEDEQRFSRYFNRHPRPSLRREQNVVWISEKFHSTNSSKHTSPVSEQTSHYTRAFRSCLWSSPWVAYLMSTKCWIGSIFFSIVLISRTNASFTCMERSTNKT